MKVKKISAANVEACSLPRLFDEEKIEVDLSKEKKSRDWLFSQSDLKKQIYELLKGENHA